MFGFGLSAKVIGVLAILLVLSGLALKHSINQAAIARAGQRQAVAAAKAVREDHDAQLVVLQADSDQVRERERAGADIRAEVAAVAAAVPVASARACVDSPVMGALFDQLRGPGAAPAAPADARRPAPVRARPHHSGPRRVAHGPGRRGTVPGRTHGRPGLPRQAVPS